MARTPDRRAGPLSEEKLVFEQTDDQGDPVVDPTEVGGMTYHDGSFSMRDSLGVFDPRSGGGSGLPTPDHIGQHLVATTSSYFLKTTPIVSTTYGWLVNNGGHPLVHLG